MRKIIAFAGSNSSNSINYKLVKYTVSLIDGYDIQLLNMVNMPFPIFSEDDERQFGYQNSLIKLKKDIFESDGVIISVNEHNGNPSAYFKNLIDWLSRLEHKFLLDKPVFLMGTSSGKRGALSAIVIAEQTLPRFGAKVDNVFSLPLFDESFSKKKGVIINDELKQKHQEQLNDFLSKI